MYAAISFYAIGPTPNRQAAAELALCIPCAVGNFSDQAGASSCLRCPEGAEWC